jgi:hypothetical protein
MENRRDGACERLGSPEQDKSNIVSMEPEQGDQVDPSSEQYL